MQRKQHSNNNAPINISYICPRMKQFSVYLLLALHINFFMFLPQCPEMDVRDANGQQQEDINSLIEWANVALGIDTTPDDEDDDNGTKFIVLKNFDYKILHRNFH